MSKGQTEKLQMFKSVVHQKFGPKYWNLMERYTEDRWDKTKSRTNTNRI